MQVNGVTFLESLTFVKIDIEHFLKPGEDLISIAVELRIECDASN
jgi:hypothetical protein